MHSVAIMLSTYNGGAYLKEQLDSIRAQTHSDWTLWVSDDGSRDNSIALLENYQSQLSPQSLHILSGPRQGFAKNFLAMACRPEIEADFYAFSDQDDIWEADKLARALQALAATPPHIPALYCSRTYLVDANNNPLGLSPLFAKAPSFKNALVQSLAGGNTMVFNAAARRLLCQAGWELPVVTHDWWLYLLVTGCGGVVHYDHHPSLRYRQHASNLVGMNTGLRAKWHRVKKLWQGQFKTWNSAHIQAVGPLHQLLTPENQTTLNLFIAARQGSLWQRLSNFVRGQFYRQTRLDQIALLAAAVFKKL